MKTIVKTFLLIPFFALLLFTSCQDEVVDITSPEESEAIIAESELASLIFSTSLMDGSFDNILDSASCTSVKLPVTVKIRGLEITIDSEEGFQIIEALFDEFDDDEDDLDFIFPITLILADHEEIVIDNEDALEALIEACNGDDEEDEDIECIDFEYPISFSVFDEDFLIIDVISIDSDKELYRFLERIRNEEVIASINFPITLEYDDEFDDTTIEVNSNEELARVIKEARATCDEDDDNDYGDDDFTKEGLDAYLQTCTWVVDEYKRDGTDKTDTYEYYALDFKEDGVVDMRSRGGDLFTGSWSTTETERGVLLNLDFETLADFTLEWVVYELDDDEIKLYETGGNRIILDKECHSILEITKERVEDYLEECYWRVDSLTIDGVSKSADYIGTPLEFYDDNVVKLRVEGGLVTGTYQIGNAGSNLTLKITLDGRPELQLEWLINFLEDNIIKLQNNTNDMILTRHCTDSDDEIEEIEDILYSQDWRITQYEDNGVDKTAEFADWAFGFDDDGKAYAEGDGRNVYGSWFSYRNDGLFLDLNYAEDALIDALDFRWKITGVSATKIQLKEYDASGAIIRILVFEKW